MQDRKDTTLNTQVDGSRRKLALALLGGFAGASLLEACEEAEPGALKAQGLRPDISQLNQALMDTSIATYDTAVELNSQLGPSDKTKIAIVTGGTALNDGWGGLFYWDYESELPIDSTSVFGSASSEGRWLRVKETAVFKSVEKIAALKSIDTTNLETGTVAIVRGYRTQNDGGGGEFYFLREWSDASGTGEIMPKIPGLAPPAEAITSDLNVIIEGTHFRPPTGKPGRWVRAGCAARVRSVRRPEEWGADNTGVHDSTHALQVALNWCRDNNAYLQGMGKYRISSTLYITGTGWGFEFGPAGDINGAPPSGGLIWYGGDNVAGVSESTYKPMIQLGMVQPPLAGYGSMTESEKAPGIVGLQCGPICLNNRVNMSKGVCGIRWNSYDAQCYGCDFKQIEIYGMDGGLILGTRAQTSNSGPYPRDDVAENAVFSMVRTFEVKHPIFINGGSNDMVTFENLHLGVYVESANGFWNGPSSYGIRVNSLESGLTFKKMSLGHMDMVTNEALIDIVAGGVEISHANLENGYRTCLGIRVGASAGGRGPVILRNIYTHAFADSSGNVVQINANLGVVMDACSWRGNVNIQSNTGFVTGSCLFVGNYNFTGSVDRRVSVATMWDTDANFVLDNKRVGGPHNADTYNALTSVTAPLLLATGTIKNQHTTERTAQADATLFGPNGAPKDLFDVVFPAGVEGAAMIDLECLFYRGGSLTPNTFAWKATARFTIHKVATGSDPFVFTSTISVPSDAEKVLRGAFTTASAVASATTVTNSNKVTLQLAQTNNLNDYSRAQIKATMIHFPSAVTLNPVTT